MYIFLADSEYWIARSYYPLDLYATPKLLKEVAKSGWFSP